MNQKLIELRQKHPRFSYDSHQVQYKDDGVELIFSYTLAPDLHFSTKLFFAGVDQEHFLQLDQNLVSEWALQIGMIESFSYWKLACPGEFVIHAGYFSETQLLFWRELLQKGLSEFYFVNQINGWENEFVHFVCTAQKQEVHLDTQLHSQNILIPVGGGKDSVVALELAKELGKKVTTFTLNTRPQLQKVLEVSDIQNNISVTRKLDPQLVELNKQAYLNGHTPFSAMLAFVSTLAAYLYDFSEVVLSNEFSANEGNTTFLGQSINHQYSKSLEFEENFRTYMQTYLSKSVQYFSALRPLHELQIAKLFAQYPQYFPVFLSCNRGQQRGAWCAECPKCLFVYIMLSPFVSEAALYEIFQKDLFTDQRLTPIFEELTGMVECKSLECVGTREETLLALSLTLQKFSKIELPYLLKYAADHFPELAVNQSDRQVQFLQALQTKHFVPNDWVSLMKLKITGQTL